MIEFDPPSTPVLKSIWRNTLKRTVQSTAGFRKIRPNTIKDTPWISNTVSERDIATAFLKSRASFRKLKLTHTPNPKIERPRIDKSPEPPIK